MNAESSKDSEPIRFGDRVSVARKHGLDEAIVLAVYRSSAEIITRSGLQAQSALSYLTVTNARLDQPEETKLFKLDERVVSALGGVNYENLAVRLREEHRLSFRVIFELGHPYWLLPVDCHRVDTFEYSKTILTLQGDALTNHYGVADALRGIVNRSRWVGEEIVECMISGFGKVANHAK